jgi:hypothetical protein
MSFAMFGVALNHFLPESCVSIILVVVLADSIKKTNKKLKE